MSSSSDSAFDVIAIGDSGSYKIHISKVFFFLIVDKCSKLSEREEQSQIKHEHISKV